MADVAVPVLVVGGGPVGLSTVIGLRRFGIDCLLVERHPSTSLFPKGRGISRRTMEIFRQWGIEEKVTAAGLRREESLSIYVAPKRLEKVRGETVANSHLPPPIAR